VSNQTIRWGIIGAGIIAHKMAEAINLEPDNELVAVASKSPERAQTFADQYQIDSETYARLVSRDDIDVVYVATTHNFHADNALLALAHGKHVVIEKPFTVNAPQAQVLIDCAKRHKVFLMEAIWTRFLPSMITLRDTIQSGRIGAVKVANINFGGIAPDYYLPRLIDPALAGGVTLDMGIYPISMLCYWLGELPQISHSHCHFSNTGVDEIASYQLVFPSGCIATVNTSFNLLLGQEVSLFGATGRIDYPNFQSADAFTLRELNGREWRETETISNRNADNGFIFQVREAARCIRAGELESPIIPLAETLGIMQVLDAIREQLPLKYDFE
jgi:predicted dehydrogenase